MLYPVQILLGKYPHWNTVSSTTNSKFAPINDVTLLKGLLNKNMTDWCSTSQILIKSIALKIRAYGIDVIVDVIRKQRGRKKAIFHFNVVFLFFFFNEKDIFLCILDASYL